MHTGSRFVKSAAISANKELSWLQDALTAVRMAVFEWDIKSGTVHWSENAADVLGLPSMKGLEKARQFEELIGDERIAAVQGKRLVAPKPSGKQKPDAHYECEYSLKLPDGRHAYLHEHGTRVSDAKGNLHKIIATVTPKLVSEIDVFSSALIQSSLEEAYHYPLVFMEALQKALHASTKSKKGALLIAAIENMPMIISGYGHASAEQIIIELEEKIRAAIGKQGQVFRIQREQFAVIFGKIGKDAMIAQAREITGLLKRFGMSATIQPLHIVPAVGAVMLHEVCQGGQASVLDVIDHAYITLKSHNGDALGMPEDASESRAASIKQMEMATYVHSAIHSDRLQLAYQPVIQAKTGKIAHYECLLRLRGEDGRIASAGALIPVAERMGIINIIDQLVLEMVVEDMMRDPNVVLAFNISNLTTNDSEWLDSFTKVLEASPEIAPRLIVEITETAAQRDLGETAYFVAALQGMGCRVALDDFGSGYTSFRQLKGLSCDMIKIDGSFIRELPDNPDNRFFVKTLLDFTQGFGLETVAEMVENGETAKILMDLGVEYMQGYYFGKPENERNWMKSGN
jgi:EAL domain-containing protein (putative c-di-GMP-specific phosphodiesterase class I)/GGDEF domain-containing protein